MSAHERDAEAERLLRRVQDEVRETAALTGLRGLRPEVVAALRAVPRHAFVPEELAASAYVNAPLPIGRGQTISQPYIVALMTDLLEPAPTHTVLEIGTGSGFQAALLARLVQRVYSTEIIPELAAEARARLAALGCDNVEVLTSDGGAGWPEHAPYDGIIVTAAAPAVPPALVEQLRPGGRLVIPLGSGHWSQQLVVITKHADGGTQRRDILPVAFVPLTGSAGHPPPAKES